MKYLVALTLIITLIGCATKVPYTNQIKEEFNLHTEKQLKQVQFYLSQTITLQRERQSGSSSTDESGALVTNKSSEEDRITFQAHTPAIFEGTNEKGDMQIRFEAGNGRYLTFNVRQENQTAKFYLVAAWEMNKGGEIIYGNQKYSVASTAGNAYLLVKLKKLQQTKRQDRVVRGMKV